ncbi:hypothetical protein FRB95_009045 [Tulasnella sp. JGI-2019a]|nr:hypothetical protein FRB93_010004 [Tulasnella sp. JGI-2019a]KAG9026264.1 hypothetical protein FRB95_009045 [Tulasnella sp. JGI-2019a]
MHKSETSMSLYPEISDTESFTASDPIVGDSKHPTTNEDSRNNGKPNKRYTKRTEFFLTPVYFLVGDTLYSIPEIMFPGAGYLKSASNLSSGKSEDEPVELDVTVSEMDSLMSVLLDRRINSPLDLTIEKWSQALGLATLWKLDAARNFIIDHITRHFPNSLANQIRLADDYDVGQWLHPAYETICERDTPPTEEEVSALGPKRLVAIYKIREACRKPEKVNLTRFHCQYCLKVWVFESIAGSPPPTSLSCQPCGGYYLVAAPAVAPSDSPAKVESAGKLIKASTELEVTPGGTGRTGRRGQRAKKDSEGVVDTDECNHDFIWKPTQAKKPGKGGVVCIKICLKCGISE